MPTVSVFYGEKQALKEVSIKIYEDRVTAFIGPSGCGKSTFLRCLNRMNDTIPAARVTGRIELDGEDIYQPGMDVVQLRARVGMVFQKPNPFPKSIFENVAYGPRIHGLASSKSELDGIVEKSLKRAGLWDEVKDRLQESGTGLVRRPAAAAVHRPRDRRRSRSHPDGRTLLGARPDRHGEIEELIHELRGRYAIVDRHPQHAAGRAGLAADRVLPPRRAGRIRQDLGNLHQSARAAHPGLYYRPLRLIGAQ